ncbi:MAG TPA: hypothetical protein VK472_07930 [Allosphingosinicella sp.]|nr:hypothetical protein [Allosphingosinicella sp.]
MVPVRDLPLLPLALIAAASADEAPPHADPAGVERLMARLDAEQALPHAVAEKVQKADRISGAVLKVAPEKIDPQIAIALIAR